MKRLLWLVLLVPCFSFAHGWECISQSAGIACNTWRWAVPHGWMVSTDNAYHGVAMTYIPDQMHEWVP